MNKNTRYLWLLLLAAFQHPLAKADCSAANCSVASTCDTTCSTSVNTWLPRAFSSYSSRQLIQEKPLFQTESNRDEWFGTLSMATEYMANFGQKCGSCKNLGARPFWSGTNTMTVGNNDGSANVDAYQFGLGNVVVGEDGIGGTISLNPQIMHIGTDLLLYFTQKKDERGFFFKLDAPLGAMRIKTQLTELTAVEPDGQTFFTQTAVAGTAADSLNLQYTWSNEIAGTLTNSFYPGPDRRYSSLVSAFAGGLGNDDSLGGNSSKPIGLLNGRIAAACDKQTEIRLADLSASVGYNVWANDKGLLGVAFKATMPTGNVPTAQYALEPIFGRGGAWGVGAEVMGHYKAWTNHDETKFLDVWLQGEVLHLVPGRTPNMRTFDLKANGKGSKYLLLQYYQAESDNTRTAQGILQAANITTLPVISKIAVEGSVALMADFHCHNWNAAIGGEFWGRSKERLCINFSQAVNLRLQNLNDFAVVGRQVSAYNIVGNTGTGISQNSYATFLCEPLATISKSQDTVVLVNTHQIANTSVNPPTPATNYILPTTLPTGIADARVAANRIPADLNDALDIAGAAAGQALTGKVFGQIGYTWNEHRYTPSASVFGGAEFTNNNNNAAQLWSVGIQGSLNF